jgi:hypothetical protein
MPDVPADVWVQLALRVAGLLVGLCLPCRSRWKGEVASWGDTAGGR